MNLASYFNEQPDALAEIPAVTQNIETSQKRITQYVAEDPRHGCIPQPALIDFDLAKHGEWIKLEAIKDLQDEYDRQWGFMSCQQFALIQ